MAKIAFDVDNTLYKVIYTERNGEIVPIGQVPDYEVIALLISLQKLGNVIYVWSAGGIQYTNEFIDKFGLRLLGNVYAAPKTEEWANLAKIDITFDDQKITLGKVNIVIPREVYEE